MSESNGLLDRVGRVEATQQEIFETIQALAQVVGPGEVQARLGAIKRDKMAQAIAEAVKNGNLEPSDAIAEKSLVVGQQLSKDGAPLFPGRFQVFVTDAIEEVRKALLGKKVGDTIPLSDGGTVKIDEIYAPPGSKRVLKAKKSKKVAKSEDVRDSQATSPVN
jgi:hypothetical protein